MNTIWIVMPVLIMLMFMLGIGLTKSSFIELAKKPLPVVAGLLGQLVFLPLIAFGVAVMMKLPPVYFMGLLLIALSPGGSSSNVFSKLAGGDVALSVTLTALSSIITLFTIPVCMSLVAGYVSDVYSSEIHLPAGKLLMQNIVLLFVPMFAGVLMRRYFEKSALAAERFLSKIAFPALMLLALLFFLQYPKEIYENFSSIGSSVVIMILVAMGAGALLSILIKSGKSIRRTIVIEVGMQNAAQAIAISTSPFIFNNGEMAIPAIIYALVMNIVLLSYVAIVKKNK